jgi:Protein of unknown function (DUF1579)
VKRTHIHAGAIQGDCDESEIDSGLRQRGGGVGGDFNGRLGVVGRCQGPPSPQSVLKAMAEAGRPGAEHKKLEPFVGDWNVTLKMWTDPSQPPAELKGTAERKWILGGRFVQETFKGEFDGKPFEGMGVLGYDSAQKKFTIARFCGLSSTASNSLATCDGSGTTFRCATEENCPVSGDKIKGRDEVIVESNDRIVTNVFKTFDGQEVKVMEIVSVRKN